jgi:hypothetical protein
VTYALTSIAVGAHALAGFARGLEMIAASTETKGDDAAARAFREKAEALDRFVAKISAAHSKIFPRGRA